jgi:hypothetical protein
MVVASLPGCQGGVQHRRDRMTNDAKPTPLSDDDLDGIVGGGPGAAGAGAPGPFTNAAMGDTFAVMELFQKLAQEQRGAAREMRDSARDSQYASLDAAAQKMREAAGQAVASGIVSGAVSIASGAISIGAMAQNSKSSMGDAALAAAKSLGEAAPGAGLQPRTSAQAGQLAEGMGKMIAGAGTGGGIAQSDAQKNEAQKSEAQSQVAASQAEFINNLQQVVTDVRQKMQDIANSQTEAMRSITRI